MRCCLSSKARVRVCPAGSSYPHISLSFWHGLQIGRASSHYVTVSIADWVGGNIEQAVALSSFFGDGYTLIQPVVAFSR
jgi:hypothetical protein